MDPHITDEDTKPSQAPCTGNLPTDCVALKVVSATFLLVCFVNLKECTCETKKVFYSTSKALFILDNIKF